VAFIFFRNWRILIFFSCSARPVFSLPHGGNFFFFDRKQTSNSRDRVIKFAVTIDNPFALLVFFGLQRAEILVSVEKERILGFLLCDSGIDAVDLIVAFEHVMIG
jgi:hypothetical protein